MDDNPQKLGSDQEAPFPRAFRENTARPAPLSPMISGLLNWQRINFSCFKPHSLCSLSWQPQSASVIKLFCRSKWSRFGHWDIFQVNSCIPLTCSIMCWTNVHSSLLSFAKLLQLHHALCVYTHTHTHTHTHIYTYFFLQIFSSFTFRQLKTELSSQSLSLPPYLSLRDLLIG